MSLPGILTNSQAQGIFGPMNSPIIEPIHSMLTEFNKFLYNGHRPTIFDASNFASSVGINAVIVIKNTDYHNLKNIIPPNSVILIVSITGNQKTVLHRNLATLNVNVSVDQIVSKIDQMIISFLRSHEHPIYESEYLDNIDDEDLWTICDGVNLNAKLVINGINQSSWRGYAFRGVGFQGMEWCK